MEAITKKLRVIYWIGALADLFFAVAMVTPSLWGALFRIPDYAPSLQHRLDMGLGAALMLGWASLLRWASALPVDRRGVLALTLFPVLAGIGLTSVLAIVTGAMPLKGVLWVFGLKIFLCAIFGYGLVLARRVARQVA